MSTELSIFKNLPTLTNGGSDTDTDSLAGSGGMRRLVASGGVFREMIGGKEYRVSEERSINVVIVRVAPENYRVFYKGSYVEGQTSTPVCWSTDGGKTPAADSPEKQSPNCVNCPQNIKGSGTGETKACRFHRRIAVVIDGEVERREVYQFLVPARSVFGDGERGKMPLQKYAQYVKSQGGGITQIVTEVRFDTSVTYDKVTFKPLRPLTQDEFDIVNELRDMPEALNAIKLDVKPKEQDEDSEASKPAPKAAPKPAPKPVAKPAPVEEVVDEGAEEEAVIEEPKKVPSKKIPVAESKLADIVQEWDD